MSGRASLEGRVAAVTGATRGVGRATARALANVAWISWWSDEAWRRVRTGCRQEPLRTCAPN